MKAIGYVRVSTDEQAREGVSLDNQKAKIQAYCDLKDFDLVEIIEDAGISAKNLNRPGAQKVLDMAKRKEVGAVVVYKLDRMFRSTTDALETTKLFDKWGVGFHSISEALDTKCAMGRFFFTLISAIAELERAVIGERTRDALAHKRAKGEKTGGDVPYGSDSSPAGFLVGNETEQKGIGLMVNLRGRGYSLCGICRELEKEGYKPRGSRWHPNTVNRILRRAANG